MPDAAESSGDPSAADPGEGAADVVMPDDVDVITPPRNAGGRAVAGARFEFHQGPLPSPADFGAYEKVQQGAADRILKMAEESLAHRRRMDEQDSRLERERMASDAKATQHLISALAIVGSVIGVALIGSLTFLAFVLIDRGDVLWGLLVGVVDIVAAGLGLLGASRSRRGRQHRRRAPTPDDEVH